MLLVASLKRVSCSSVLQFLEIELLNSAAHFVDVLVITNPVSLISSSTLSTVAEAMSL